MTTVHRDGYNILLPGYTVTWLSCPVTHDPTDSTHAQGSSVGTLKYNPTVIK